MAQPGSGGSSILTGLIYLVQEKDHQQMFQIHAMADLQSWSEMCWGCSMQSLHVNLPT